MLDAVERGQLYGRVFLATSVVFVLTLFLLAGAPRDIFLTGAGSTGAIALANCALWLRSQFGGAEPGEPPHEGT